MLSYKRKYLFFTTIILLVLSLVGCNEKEVNQAKSKENNNITIVKLDGKTIISATVSRVGKNMLDIKKPHITYNQKNSKELQIFVDAIQRAEKMNGIVDMTSPDYLITLTFEDKTISKYTLWLRNGGGSLMNENDSNHIYKLPKDLIDDLNKIVK